MTRRSTKETSLSSSPRSRRIEIIGGGIAGLTLAHSLRRPEWNVNIRERGRDRAHPEVDTAFGMWRPAMKALEIAGFDSGIRREGISVRAATIRTATGQQLVRTADQDVVMIGRATLRKILIEELPSDIGWSDEHVDVQSLPEADVVVGADGAGSVVRQARWGPRSAARSPNLTVVRGVVDGDHSGGEVSEYWGDGVLYGITPLPGGRTNWFTAFAEQRFSSTDKAIERVRRNAAEFPPQVANVISAATPEQTLVSGIHVSRSVSSFVRGNSVLIGDAAHAMRPNLGRGACEAIRDAVALGSLLNSHDPGNALSRYRSRRLIGPQLIRSSSSMVARIALARGRTARVRDRVLSALP